MDKLKTSPQRHPNVSRSVGITIPAYKPDIPRLNNYIQSIQELDFVNNIHIELDNPSEIDISSIDGFDSINTAEERRGKGKAITAGFNFLSTDVLAFADADGATPADSLKKVISPVINGNVDMAIGSRRHPYATIESHQTVIRQWMGDAFAWINRRLLSTSLYDYQCGAKALLTEVWDTIRHQIYESGFAFDLELIEMACLSGYNICEVPIVWEDVVESTVNPISDTIPMLISAIRIRYRAENMGPNI